ncbi:MAG: hypothetical protein ABIR67_01810 [Gaiellaceae bacterium]
MRRTVGLLVLLGAPLYFRRRRDARRERVQLGFDDGSSVTLEDGAPEAERLLALARRAL